MSYRRYRSWRYRGHGNNKPSKYSVLVSLFGDAVTEIKSEFLELPDDARDELLSDYGNLHGASAEQYAKRTFASWKSGATTLSGQTMERLVSLVPPYLPPHSKITILKSVLKKHRRRGIYSTVQIDVERPNEGLARLDEELSRLNIEDQLAYLPSKVMDAASWLYDDDVTAARAMLAEATKVENDLVKSNARRELELLKRTIKSGQIKSATYKVEMPAGTLSVVASTPSLFTKISRFFG